MENEIILFEDINFKGKHIHVFRQMPNLKMFYDFNDKASSVIVVNGTWTLYEDVDFKTPYKRKLTPGLYSSLPGYGIPNDRISSLKPE